MDYENSWILLAVFLLGNVLSHVSGLDTYADETTLRATLKSGYDREVRPSTPTAVTMFYSIRTLQALDISIQAMSTTGWLSMYWTDPRLVWNATDYSNITDIDTDWVWRPELMNSNGIGDPLFGGYVNDDVRFRVYNTGTVRWILPLPVTTTCDVDISRFPFDSQSCYIELYFMGLNGVDVDPNITQEVMTQSYVPNSEWHYDSGFVTTAVLPLCCPLSTYHMVQFHVNFTRLRPFYVINLIIPSILFSLLMLLTFLLPTESGERLGYSLTILLSYTVLLTISTDMMPTTSKQIPFISVYLLALLVLCSLSVLNVVLTVKMFHLTTTPPDWLQKCCAKVEYIVFLKCCKSKDKVSPSDWALKVEDNENHNNVYEKDQETLDKDSSRDTEKPEKITWCQLSEAIDRLCFYLYSMANLILLIIFVIEITGG